MLPYANNLTWGPYPSHTPAQQALFRIHKVTNLSPKPLNANPATSKRPAVPSCINGPICEPSATLTTAGGDGRELSRK